jgi:hypothetical protein
MRGDEDLGQDITMKGQPFHYSQQPANKANVQLNGDDGKFNANAEPEKVHDLIPETYNKLSNQSPQDNNLNYPHARTAFYAQASNKGVQWTEGNGSLHLKESALLSLSLVSHRPLSTLKKINP